MSGPALELATVVLVTVVLTVLDRALDEEVGATSLELVAATLVVALELSMLEAVVGAMPPRLASSCRPRGTLWLQPAYARAMTETAIERFCNTEIFHIAGMGKQGHWQSEPLCEPMAKRSCFDHKFTSTAPGLPG